MKGRERAQPWRGLAFCLRQILIKETNAPALSGEMSAPKRATRGPGPDGKLVGRTENHGEKGEAR